MTKNKKYAKLKAETSIYRSVKKLCTQKKEQESEDATIWTFQKPQHNCFLSGQPIGLCAATT
eukprot:snap_masked-scaffold_2-processed-gene-8.25-mRNA-1 protein AED:1.00 eAED:1.00 QI:0/-1/0/0/-1/1/1/0/61